jgi:multidrug resistance protein
MSDLAGGSVIQTGDMEPKANSGHHDLMIATSFDRTTLWPRGAVICGEPQISKVVRIAAMADFIGISADGTPAFVPSTVAATGIDGGAGNGGASMQIAVICALAATGSLSTNIFLPSLPSMALALHVSSAAVTSAITVYLTIFAAGQLIVGPLSDRFGRRPLILIGLCLFVAGTSWCAMAGDLSNLLIGRSIQALGACAASVLARAIARDLFDGRDLANVMASITVATAAAPGFSPLLGGALDHFLGWRAEFAFVGVFAVSAAVPYAVFVGETIRSPRTSINPRTIARSYFALIGEPRFYVPARTSALMMVGLFSIFSAAPRVLLEEFGFSSITLGLLFAGVVFVGVRSRHLGAEIIRVAWSPWGHDGRPWHCCHWKHRGPFRCAGGERLVPSLSSCGCDLPARSGHCESDVEHSGAVAIRRQGGCRSSAAGLLANGGSSMWSIARGCRLQ